MLEPFPVTNSCFFGCHLDHEKTLLHRLAYLKLRWSMASVEMRQMSATRAHVVQYSPTSRPIAFPNFRPEVHERLLSGGQAPLRTPGAA